MPSYVNPSCWRVFWESQPNLVSTFSRIVCEERRIPQRWDLRIKGSFRSFTNIQYPVRCGITAGGYIGVFSRILDVLNSYSSYDHTCIHNRLNIMGEHCDVSRLSSKQKRPRYSSKLIHLTMSIYSRSPAAMKAASSNGLHLPSMRTIARYKDDACTRLQPESTARWSSSLFFAANFSLSLVHRPPKFCFRSFTKLFSKFEFDSLLFQFTNTPFESLIA